MLRHRTPDSAVGGPAPPDPRRSQDPRAVSSSRRATPDAVLAVSVGDASSRCGEPSHWVHEQGDVFRQRLVLFVNLADARPVRRVQRAPQVTFDPSAWPFDLPAVRQLLDEGLDLPAGVTVLVGENGSGKSTIIEGLAQAFGLNAEGGSRGAQHVTRATESPLGQALQLVRSPNRLVSSYCG